MNRTWILRAGVAAAAVALCVGAATTAQAAPGQGGCIRSLVDNGTISQTQAYELREATDALLASGVAGRAAHDQALADLVANGTLTQAQSDAIVALRQQRAGRGGQQGHAPRPAQPSGAQPGSAGPTAGSGASAAS